MTDILHWIIDFLGINNTYNDFSTHMYNFWSGFGAGLIQFSLLGAIVVIYRHYVKRIKQVESIIKKPLHKFDDIDILPGKSKKK